MPLDTSRVLELTPVVTGSMVEVPPDLPDGHWSGPCNVRDGIAEDGREKYFRLFLEWTATEDIAGTNPSSVGGSATHMVTFYPESHKNANMTKTEVKKLCDALGIAEPDTSSLEQGSIESLAPFVEALEESQREFWTTNYLDKKNGVMRTRIHYTEPGKKLELAPIETPPKQAHKNGVAKKNGKK